MDTHCVMPITLGSSLKAPVKKMAYVALMYKRVKMILTCYLCGINSGEEDLSTEMSRRFFG